MGNNSSQTNRPSSVRSEEPENNLFTYQLSSLRTLVNKLGHSPSRPGIPLEALSGYFQLPGQLGGWFNRFFEAAVTLNNPDAQPGHHPPQHQPLLSYYALVSLFECFLHGTPRQQVKFLFQMYASSSTGSIEEGSYSDMLFDLAAISECNEIFSRSGKTSHEEDEAIAALHWNKGKAYQAFVQAFLQSAKDSKQLPFDNDKFVHWATHSVPHLVSPLAYFLAKKILRETATEVVSWPPRLVNPKSSAMPYPSSINWVLSCFLEHHVDSVQVLYSSSNGISLSGLLGSATGYEGPTVLLIHSEGGNIFGAYLTAGWRPKPNFVKDVDCFLFSVLPKANSFRSTGVDQNNFYLHESSNRYSKLPSGIGFGGRLEKFRLKIDKDLEVGDCGLLDSTYERGQICPDTSFNIVTIEVWGLGGAKALEGQAKARQREAQDIAKSRKVQVGLMMNGGQQWHEGADKYILDLAGVTTNTSHVRDNRPVAAESESSDGVIPM